jgi:hypothetical protein
MPKKFRSVGVELVDGCAEYMGDGVWVTVQRDELTREQHRTVLHESDLKAMLAALG